jgi:hypothetical protein
MLGFDRKINGPFSKSAEGYFPPGTNALSERMDDLPSSTDPLEGQYSALSIVRR